MRKDSTLFDTPEIVDYDRNDGLLSELFSAGFLAPLSLRMSRFLSIRSIHVWVDWTHSRSFILETGVQRANFVSHIPFLFLINHCLSTTIGLTPVVSEEAVLQYGIALPTSTLS